MRMLVKLPGPRPATIASISRGSSTSSSTAASRSPAREARACLPSDVAQTAPNDVAVSKAKITVDPHASMRFVDVPEGNRRPRAREPVAAVLGPFDEGDRAVEVRLEIAPLLRVEARDAVEVEMRDRNRRLVAVPDREGRARDSAGHTERPCRTADERRLSRTELSRDGDDVARGELRREPPRERLRLLRR